MNKKIFFLLKLKFHNAIRHFKTKGLFHVLKLVLSNLGFVHFTRSLVFLKLDLAELPMSSRADFNFDILNADDIKNESEFDNGYFSKEQSIYRLLNGHKLFVLRKDQRIIYYLWAEYKNASVWWFDNMPLCLEEDAALISGAYTIPEFRGQGIAITLKKEIFAYLKNMGIKYLIGVVHQNNIIALKIDKKLGFKEYQKIDYSRYWHIRRYKVQDFNSKEIKNFVTILKAPKDLWKTFL